MIDLILTAGLALHIGRRNLGQPEDFRYARWRREAGTAWWTMIIRLVMTMLLRRVSGVAMLERTLQETKPGYTA